MSIIWGSPQQLFLKGPAPKGSGALLSVPVLPSALLTLGNPHLVKTNVVSRNRTTHISAHPQTSLAVPSESPTPENQAPSLCAAGGTSSLLWGDAVWGYLTPGAGILLQAPVTCSEPCRQAPCGTQGGQSHGVIPHHHSQNPKCQELRWDTRQRLEAHPHRSPCPSSPCPPLDTDKATSRTVPTRLWGDHPHCGLPPCPKHPQAPQPSTLLHPRLRTPRFSHTQPS